MIATAGRTSEMKASSGPRNGLLSAFSICIGSSLTQEMPDGELRYRAFTSGETMRLTRMESMMAAQNRIQNPAYSTLSPAAASLKGHLRNEFADGIDRCEFRSVAPRLGRVGLCNGVNPGDAEGARRA